MRAFVPATLLALAACIAAPPPAPVEVVVAARPDPDGFLYFNDAALYRSAMRRCAARLPDYADEAAEAERVLADARTRYAARGGNPNRADLARIYARSDRELAAQVAAQSPAEAASACERLAVYHARNVASYGSAS